MKTRTGVPGSVFGWGAVRPRRCCWLRCSLRWGASPRGRRDCERCRQHLLGQRVRGARSGSGTWMARGPLRLCSAASPARPVRGGDRPRGRQDLLGQLPPARSGSGTWMARAPPRPCSAARAARAGWRSTPRPARSTGPTSAPARSGSANLDGSGIATALFTGRGTPTGVTIDPAAGKIYWINQFHTDRSGWRTWTARSPPDPVRRRGPARSGWRSTPRPTRSTGPTFRGGGTVRVANLDGSLRLDPVRRRGRPGRGGDRPGRQDLLGRFSPAHGPVGNLDGTGTASDPVQRREVRTSPRCCAPAGTGFRPSPAVEGRR